ncbi:MAG: CARDB domain-containing protein [Planctomycetota bacterium]|jgi:hypothetical protein
MHRQTLTVGLVGLAILILAGCGADLVPERVPGTVGPNGFCRREGEDLVVRVTNIGNKDSGTTTTRVGFTGASGVSGVSAQTKVTNPVPKNGGSVDVRFKIPAECFNPDCDFVITVDVNDDENEQKENNNIAKGTCPG